MIWRARRTAVWFLALGAVILMAACHHTSGGNSSSSGIATARSQLARATAPTAAESEIDTLVAGNTEFAFDLYRAIRQSDGNFFYSPYSISLALTLAYAGARTQTEAEMAAVLHYGLSQARLHPTFNALDLILKSREEGSAGTGGTGFRLHIANAVWGEKTRTFLPEYLDILAVNYGAGLNLLDFLHNPESSRVTINDWVAGETEDKIRDLIPAGALTADTRLVLTNAIYFNAAWENPFDNGATAPGSFTLLNGEAIATDLMRQTHQFEYAAGSGYQAVELPYSGGKLAMLLLVPDTGKFRQFEETLTAAKVTGIVASLAATRVNLAMPKFTFAGDLGLRDTLRKMGMPAAFQQADFSGMDGTRELFITDVLHKAWVKVDEEGTEAAAATAVIIGVTAAPGATVDLTIDRPFIFVIRDIPTGTVLFVGRVVNPRG